MISTTLEKAVIDLNAGWNAKEPESQLAERIDLCHRLALASPIEWQAQGKETYAAVMKLIDQLGSLNAPDIRNAARYDRLHAQIEGEILALTGWSGVA